MENWRMVENHDDWKAWYNPRTNVAIGMEYGLDTWKVVQYLGDGEVRLVDEGLTRAEARETANRAMRTSKGARAEPEDFDFTGVSL
jgi:hypothetical protein